MKAQQIKEFININSPWAWQSDRKDIFDKVRGFLSGFSNSEEVSYEAFLSYAYDKDAATMDAKITARQLKSQVANNLLLLWKTQDENANTIKTLRDTNFNNAGLVSLNTNVLKDEIALKYLSSRDIYVLSRASFFFREKLANLRELKFLPIDGSIDKIACIASRYLVCLSRNKDKWQFYYLDLKNNLTDKLYIANVPQDGFIIGSRSLNFSEDVSSVITNHIQLLECKNGIYFCYTSSTSCHIGKIYLNGGRLYYKKEPSLGLMHPSLKDAPEYKMDKNQQFSINNFFIPELFINQQGNLAASIVCYSATCYKQNDSDEDKVWSIDPKTRIYEKDDNKIYYFSKHKLQEDLVYSYDERLSRQTLPSNTHLRNEDILEVTDGKLVMKHDKKVVMYGVKDLVFGPENDQITILHKNGLLLGLELHKILGLVYSKDEIKRLDFSAPNSNDNAAIVSAK